MSNYLNITVFSGLIFLLIAIALWLRAQRSATKAQQCALALEREHDWLDAIHSRLRVMSHVTDGHGCLVSVSAEWLAQLGYARQDVIGRPFSAFIAEASRQPESSTEIGTLLRDGASEGGCLRLVKQNGQPLDVFLTAVSEQSVQGEVLRSFAVMTDISRQREAALALERVQLDLEDRVRNRTAALNEAYEQLTAEMKERKKAENILQTIAEGVSGTTGTAYFSSLVQYLPKALHLDYALVGVFAEDNDNMVDTVAVSVRGALGENFCYDLANTPCSRTKEQGLCFFPKNVRQLFPEGQILKELEVESYIGTRLFDSTGKPIGILAVMGREPFDASGTITSMLQIFASRAAAELERVKKEEELVQVRNLESLGRMAAGIAHEINNPLTNASINVQMLRKNLVFLEDETPILQRVDAVNRNIERASNIARELLLFSRQNDLNLTPVNLNNIIENAFSQITDDLTSIDVNKEFGQLPIIFGDPLKLEGLFINLFNNAIDAMPEGGKLSISSFDESGKVIVKVHDTGTGIADENISRIFDPFFTTKEVGAGTGLGLSIAYGIIQQHSGTIEAVSPGNAGTTFIIKLPVPGKEEA